MAFERLTVRARRAFRCDSAVVLQGVRVYLNGGYPLMHFSSATRRSAATLCLLLATGGCSPTGLRPAETVAAVAGEQQIAITNQTRRPIFTFVVGREMAALVYWVPCMSGPECEPLPPGATRYVPYPSAAIPEAEREALVYWWHAVRSPTGRVVRADSIRALIVKL